MSHFPPQLLLHFIHNHCKHINQLNQIHTLFITTGLLSPHHYSNSCANTHSTTTFFYNTLIRAHLLLQNPQNSLFLFTHMLTHSIPPNNHTFPSLIKAASPSPVAAKTIHTQVIRRGLSLDLFINSSIVKFYAQLGELRDAHQVFDEIPQPDIASYNSMLDALFKNNDVGSALGLFERIPQRNVVSWTSVVNGFFKNGHFQDAILWFKKMVMSCEAKPNEATLVSVISSSANSDGAGALHQGRQVHAYVFKNGIQITAFIGTALIDMYGKHGCLGCVHNVFDETARREVCTWNAMILALASNSREVEAMAMFEKMITEGVKPDAVTFVGLLTACARAGLVELGLRWFDSMWSDYKIVARMEHYGCVVDMLGRVGLLEDAAKFMRKMPMEADASVWGALLGACKVHGNVELGDAVGKKLLALEPGHCGRYMVLSNMYAEAGRWCDASELRDTMARAGIKKIAGYSKMSLDAFDVG
eukprot:TRINITY_DN13788_c2_g1_i1.p1 TRINITY_DN13788_c2_g1~~TRINITY_DN13788_c2_g1_i1.p1  ORF type:complete len:474 (-),score=74.68 TRINITY_DN13788_c2_g1_i1:611-2032(-)